MEMPLDPGRAGLDRARFCAPTASLDAALAAQRAWWGRCRTVGQLTGNDGSDAEGAKLTWTQLVDRVLVSDPLLEREIGHVTSGGGETESPTATDAVLRQRAASGGSP